MLAGAGVGSRRRMDELVAAGRITVNGRLAVTGQRVQPSDVIALDGKPVVLGADDGEQRVLMYHKPAGEIVSRDDPQGRPSVFDNLPRLDAARWIAVGRLDFNTSGLLLLTTSGDLANALMHPSSMIEREYAVRVRGELSESQAASLLAGIALDDGLAKIERIEAHGGGASNHWYHVVLYEGRYREVRRLFDAVGQPVGRLMRVRFGDLKLPPRLRPGRYEELSPADIRRLVESARSAGVTRDARTAVNTPAGARRTDPGRDGASKRRPKQHPDSPVGGRVTPNSRRGKNRRA